MGNPNSKVLNARKDVKPDEGSVPSTPILTPKIKIIDNDPRSPSANIVRTPIHSVMDVNKPGTPIVGVLHSDDLENSIVNIDPRSPTVEFVRTPIVVENQTIKLRNKNLDNVRQQLINCSPMKQEVESFNNSVRAPKLIAVSPFIKKVDQNEKRKSYVGLLETDLDFVETDIDKVTKLNNTFTKDEKEEIFEIDKFVPPLILEESNEQSENDDEPKEKISKTEISKETQSSENITEVPELLPSREDIISPIKETLEKISQIDKEIKEVIAVAHNSFIDLDEEIESKEFDKKVTNLIYEDQDIVTVIPKALKFKEGNRTPLGERNVNHNNKKAVSKLKVHDRPQKKDYAVSKIPVFKEKKGKSKIALQCENTPPRPKIVDVKTTKTQWDADKTLII